MPKALLLASCEGAPLGETGMPIDPQTTRSFWDEQHTSGHVGNLTGSEPFDELTNLRALEMVKPGANVLSIGLGLGHTTSWLLDQGCKVSVHDISSVALDKFRGRVEGAYLPDDLTELPENRFDLVLSHLVMQHMNDEALTHQMKAVVPSLADNGVFAFQFAVGWNQSKRTYRFATDVDANLPYCRTLNWMSNLVEEAGGTIIFSEMHENFPRYHMAWYVAHVVKRGSVGRTFRPKNARLWDPGLTEPA